MITKRKKRGASVRKEHSKEGVRSFILGLVAIMSFPTMIPFPPFFIFPLFIFGSLATVYGVKARRKKDSLGLVGLAWGCVALGIGFLALLFMLIALT